MPKNSPGNATNVKRYGEIKAALATSTGLSDGARLDYLTIMSVKLEHMSADVLIGKSVSPADLLALRQAIEEMSPLPAHVLTVNVVNPNDHVCVRCHCEMTDEEVALAKARTAERRADKRMRPVAANSTAVENTTPAPVDAKPRPVATPVITGPRSIHDAPGASVKEDAVSDRGPSYSTNGGGVPWGTEDNSVRY
jgi:hypothetical protein